jgi:hypothetical protein
VLIGLVALPFAPPPRPVRAAELLELRIDSLQIPIHLDQLAAWSRQRGGDGPLASDLGPWLGLLDARSRADLQRMLRAPLLRDQSLGRQLLDTWAGGQLLAELGNLLTTSDGGRVPVLEHHAQACRGSCDLCNARPHEARPQHPHLPQLSAGLAKVSHLILVTTPAITGKGFCRNSTTF